MPRRRNVNQIDDDWLTPEELKVKYAYKIMKELFIIVFIIVAMIWDAVFYLDDGNFVKDGNEVIEKEIQSDNEDLKRLFQFISFFGTRYFFWLLVPIGFFMMEPYGGLRYFAVVMMAQFVPALMTQIHHAPRPWFITPNIEALSCYYSFGYPAEHLFSLFVFGWLSLQFLAWRNKIIFSLITIIAVLLISLAQMYLGAHNYPQIVSGWTYSLVSLLIYIWVENQISKKGVYESNLGGKHIKKHLLFWGTTSVLILASTFIVWAILGALWDFPSSWIENINVSNCTGDFNISIDKEIMAYSLRSGVLVACAVFGSTLGIAITQILIISDWWVSVWWKRLIRALLAYPLPLIVEVLLYLYFPKNNIWATIIIQDGLVHFLIAFYIFGILPWVFVKLGLGETVPIERESYDVELNTRNSKKQKQEDLTFLTTTIRYIYPQRQKLIVIQTTDSIPKALKTLSHHNIYSAPVYDAKLDEYIGFIDMVDIVACIVEIFQETELLGEDFAEYTLDQKENLFAQQHAEKVADLSKRNQLIKLDRKQPLVRALEMFKATGVHRIAITKRKGKKIRNILTQSAIVDWIHRHPQLLPRSVLDKTIKELNLGTKNVISIREDEKALEAFKKMTNHRINGVAVVDHHGKLVTSISAKDIRVLEKKLLFITLYKSAKDFAKHAHSVSVIEVTESTKLRDLISKLSKQKRHRAFVVDDEKKPIAVISLGDVLGVLIEAATKEEKEKRESSSQLELQSADEEKQEKKEEKPEQQEEKEEQKEEEEDKDEDE